MDAQSLYHQIGRIIESMPEFTRDGPLTDEQLIWIGRANVLLNTVDQFGSYLEFKGGTNHLGTGFHADGIQKMIMALYNALAIAEFAAPASVRGSFIPTGNSFDAFAAISKVFQTAKRDLLIVDPYLDETILTEFGEAIQDGINIRLLADKASVKNSLQPAAERWITQMGSGKPLTVKLANEKTLHDRAIFVDSSVAWSLTQSFKDFAKRSPGEIIRADDTAELKINAYEKVWKSAASLT